MGIVNYILDENSKLTEEEMKIIENASKKPITYDEDCPELDISELQNYKITYPQRKAVGM